MRTKNPEAAMHQALEQARHRSRVGHHVILTVGGKSFYIVAIPLNDNVRPANENDAALSKPWMPDFLDWLVYAALRI